MSSFSTARTMGLISLDELIFGELTEFQMLPGPPPLPPPPPPPGESRVGPPPRASHPRTRRVRANCAGPTNSIASRAYMEPLLSAREYIYIYIYTQPAPCIGLATRPLRNDYRLRRATFVQCASDFFFMCNGIPLCYLWVVVFEIVANFNWEY